MQKKLLNKAFLLQRRLKFLLLAQVSIVLILFSTSKLSASVTANASAMNPIVITGAVADKTGPLPGVSIKIKGTSQGTITDIDGKFTLNVNDPNAVLIFSFISYQSQEVPLNGRTQIDVLMVESAQNLEEVVVVGYGSQKKVNLTGAVSAIKMDEKIAGRSVSNVSSGLTGLVPGLSVTQSSSMAGNNSANLTIRGLGTVNNANPLVVVDGMPDVDINRINMEDIESLSVLKDASSAAVYGSRAANGVILITTKSGKEGKAHIEFSSSYAVEKPINAYAFNPNYAEALTVQQRAAAQGGSSQKFRDGTIDQWMALSMVDPLHYPNTDWWSIIMRDGQVKKNNLSASGKTEKSNFYISLGTMDQVGLQIGNDFSRYNARFNYEYKMTKNLSVGTRFDGNWTKYSYYYADGFTDSNASNTGGNEIQYAIAGITPYDPQTGKYGGVMAYGEDPQAMNPLANYTNNINKKDRQELNSSAYIDWEPITGLHGRLEYGIKYYNEFTQSYQIPVKGYNFQTGNDTRVYYGENAGIYNNTWTGYKTQLNGRLNYNKTIGKNDIGAMFAYSEEYWFDRNQNGYRADRLHPSLTEIDNALSGLQTSAGGNSSSEGLRSFIGRINYTYNSRYLLEGNFRYDGSSKFLEGSQYGFFPSAALGWRFSEESFVRSIVKNALSNGKLRVSYGSLGNNSGVGRFEQQETLAAAHYMVNGSIAKGLVYKKMVNPDYTWEATNVFNLGMDLGFLNNRLTAEIDYYDRLTTGMSRPSSLSLLLSGAYDAPKINIGSLRNRGVELNLTWKDKFRDLNYSVNLNLSYNQNILVKWNEYLAKGWNYLNMPYQYVYGYTDRGIAQTWQDIYDAPYQGQYVAPGDILRNDLNGDGQVNGEDKKAYPSYQRYKPTTNFALNTNVSWKGFDIAVLLQGSTGRKDFVLNNYNNTNIPAQRYASQPAHYNDTWSLDNRTASLPRLITGSGGSNREETTFWLDDMSYLRLKNVQLGYNLPKNILDKVKISNLRIYVSGENLYTLTSSRAIDPERTGDVNATYPLTKSYSFGINLGF